MGSKKGQNKGFTLILSSAVLTEGFDPLFFYGIIGNQ
jgi:hypothetical protein